MGTIKMPRGQYARPFNIERGLKDLQGRLPHLKEVVECPVVHKTFDRFATIELLDIETLGEIDYYCPYCDALIMREFVSPDRRCFEIVDRDHQIEQK